MDTDTATSTSPIQIIIGQRGWVWVGRVSTNGDKVRIQNAKCIRRWGTTKGLGELVAGPKPTTVLDPAGTLHLHTLGVVAVYEVDQEAWNGHLS
jgi:hypothetical protein